IVNARYWNMSSQSKNQQRPDEEHHTANNFTVFHMKWLTFHHVNMTCRTRSHRHWGLLLDFTASSFNSSFSAFSQCNTLDSECTSNFTRKYDTSTNHVFTNNIRRF